jgi:exopolyphosphatase/guanosine-5'-triphosphate,3'-diphosphate pyrophosphatase
MIYNAVIDIGSSNVKLVVGSYDASSRSYEILLEKTINTKLCEGADERGTLSEEAIVRTLNAINSMIGDLVKSSWRVSGLSGHTVHLRHVVTTGGVRMAHNGLAFVRRVEDLLEMPVSLLTGTEEAHLSLRSVEAIAQSLPITVIDIGGASTEICRSGRDPISLEIGSTRLTERSRRYSSMSILQTVRLVTQCAQVENHLVDGFPIHFVGGTATSFMTLAGVRDSNKVGARHYKTSLGEMTVLIERWLKASHDELVAALGESRAEVFKAGATIMKALLWWPLHKSEVHLHALGHRFALLM